MKVKKGIMHIKGGWLAGNKEKAKKLPKGGMAQIGRKIYSKKNWKPNVRP